MRVRGLLSLVTGEGHPPIDFIRVSFVGWAERHEAHGVSPRDDGFPGFRRVSPSYGAYLRRWLTSPQMQYVRSGGKPLNPTEA
jgi:hypothetical protein